MKSQESLLLNFMPLVKIHLAIHKQWQVKHEIKKIETGVTFFAKFVPILCF